MLAFLVFPREGFGNLERLEQELLKQSLLNSSSRDDLEELEEKLEYLEYKDELEPVEKEELEALLEEGESIEGSQSRQLVDPDELNSLLTEPEPERLRQELPEPRRQEEIATPRIAPRDASSFQAEEGSDDQEVSGSAPIFLQNQQQDTSAPLKKPIKLAPLNSYKLI